MRIYTFVVIGFCLFKCSKEDPKPAAAERVVHLAGTISTASGNPIASYWKDGVYKDLTGDSLFSSVSSFFVNGSSVLIGGWILSGNFPQQGAIWQDGNETIIKGAYGGTTLITSINNNLAGVWRDDSLGWVFHKNGITRSILDTASSSPTAVATNGTDMFIAGNAVGYELSPTNPLYNTDQYAQCWKNEQLVFRESRRSHVVSIFTHQNDVYMAGYLTGTGTAPDTACYWKNNKRTNLTDGLVEGMATSIYVTNTNVYISGNVNYQAVYWKDGSTVPLVLALGGSEANSIFADENDIYIAGSYDGRPAYWKNGVRQVIASQEKKGRLSFVSVGVK